MLSVKTVKFISLEILYKYNVNMHMPIFTCVYTITIVVLLYLLFALSVQAITIDIKLEKGAKNKIYQ